MIRDFLSATRRLRGLVSVEILLLTTTQTSRVINEGLGFLDSKQFVPIASLIHFTAREPTYGSRTSCLEEEYGNQSWH